MNDVAELHRYNRPGIAKPRINALASAIMLRALLEGGCTYQDLSDVTGCSLVTIRPHVNQLYRHKLVRICDWAKDASGAFRVKVFEWAPDVRDKRRPLTSGAERCRRSRARKKMRETEAAVRRLVVPQSEPGVGVDLPLAAENCARR